MTTGLLLAAVLALTGGAGEDAVAGADDVSFTQLTIRIEGELLDTRFVDMDGDGRRDLVTAVLARRPGLAARREIRIHTMGADGTLPLEPTRVIAVPDDVVVYGIADVRDEPGKELLLMTRSGIHSLSPQVEGLRDNLRRLATCDLLYQVPSPRSLSSWSYIFERPGQKDLVLVPGADGLAVWGPASHSGGASGDDATGGSSTDGQPLKGAQSDDYAPIAQLGGGTDSLFSIKSPGAVKASAGGMRVSIDSGRNKGLFLEDAPAAYAALLEAEMNTAAPALADVNGDGLKDIVFLDGKSLRVYLATAEGFSTTPSRTEELPAWLDAGNDGDLVLNLRDLDKDGDVDAYARVSPKQDGLDRVNFSYFVMINDGQRLFPEQPQQVLRFEATGTDSEITDVNADGRPDLVVTKYELPTLTELAGGFKFTRSAFVYLAGDGPEPFERKPSLRDEQQFTIDSLQDALVDRHISGDFSGDGIADLVEVDLTGHVLIRRITFEDSFFGSGEWRVDQAPWKSLDLGANLANLQLEDVNGDGIGDFINPDHESLTLMLSHKAGGK